MGSKSHPPVTQRTPLISATHWQLVFWYIGSVGSLAFLPFVAAILSDTGRTDAEIALMMIWMPITLTLGTPCCAWIADKTGRADWVLKGATSVALLAMVAFLFVDHAVAQAICLACLALGRSPFGPLGDAITLQRLQGNHRSYGQIRMWGSILFFIAILIGGHLRPTIPHAPVLLACALMVIAMGFAWSLPSEQFHSKPTPKGILRPLFRDPLIWLFLILATLHGITITTYDNFFSLHVEQMGWSSSITGYGIATGVIAEVVVLGMGRQLLDRFGPGWLILMGVVSSLPRFWFTGTTETPEMLIAWQSLHGLGFGAFWIGGVAFLSEMAPPTAPNAAQSLLPASTFGAGYLLSLSIAASTFHWIQPGTLFQILGLGSSVTIAITIVFFTKLRTRIRTSDA